LLIDDPKKNSALKKGVWSDKVHHPAGRLITWSAPSGLNVEHTPLFMARATESAIVALWGSYHSTVPLSKVPEVSPDPVFLMKAEKYEEKCPILAKVIKEGRSKGVRNEDEDEDEDENEIYESDDEEAEAKAHETKGNSINLTKRGQQFMLRMRERETEKKPPKKYSADAIVEFNKALLLSGPNESSTAKQGQLKVHEALNTAFSEGKLEKNLILYYISFMTPLRHQMLRHLRGEAGDEVPPTLYTRLAKIPIGGTVLADRGFYFDAPSYPNVNAQITPHFLTGRDQFESNEISSDLVTCRLRWSSEAVFSRVTDSNALTDVIPYNYFTIMDAMIEWGHAHANLMQPFNKPPDY
jgi:hypothetical protein